MIIEQRECSKHGLTDFVFREKENRWRCKKCAVEAVQRKRKNIKEKALSYKGNKCEICGYDKCIDALEFHHLNASEKEFGIGHRGYTRKWSKVKEELDKCILVCANCHREIHCNEK